MTRSHYLVLALGLLGGAVLYSLYVGESLSEPSGVLSPYARPAESHPGLGDSLDSTERDPVRVETPQPVDAPLAEDSPGALEESQGPLPNEIPDTWSCNYGPLPWDGDNGEGQELLLVPDSVWEDKYAGFSDLDLAIAKGSIRAEYFKRTNDAVAERRRAGLATIFPAKYKATASGEEKLIPFKLKKSGNIPIHTVTCYPATEDKGAYNEFIWLPPAEYPEFYLLASEAMWLGKKAPD